MFEYRDYLASIEYSKRVYGDKEGLMKTLKYEKDMEKRDKYIRTKFQEACLNGHYEIVKILLEYVDIKNSDSDAALHNACVCWQHRIVKLLLDNGAKVNVKDNNGNSHLHIACEYGSFRGSEPCDTVKVLLENGADVNSMNNKGETSFCCASDIKTIKLLLAYGLNVNKVNTCGDNILHEMCSRYQYRKDVGMFKLMTNCEVNINAKNVYGETPLMIAQKHESYYIANLLMKEMKKRIYIMSLMINSDVTKNYIVKKID